MANQQTMGAACGSCEKKSEGDNEAFPFRLSDGRLFTDYRPRCQQDQYVRMANGAKSTFEHRQWMINNADQIMAQERQMILDTKSCKPCFGPNEAGTMLPETSMVSCDGKTCTFAPWEMGTNGLGQGRLNTHAANVDNSLKLYPMEGVSKSSYQKYGSVM
jgi:hypothetical protein